MVWEEVVSLLCWQGSTEQSSPARQPFAARQSVSRAVSSHWGATSLSLPLLHHFLALFCSTMDSSPSLTACLSVCHCWYSSAASLHSAVCYLFLMLWLDSLSLSSLMPNIPLSLPPYPTSPPPICCLFICPQSTVLVWLWVPPPPRLQQTLFTLLLNKPKGKHDPQWHALASLQYILNKPQRKKRGNLRVGGGIKISRSVSRPCPLVQRTSESDSSD